MNTVGTTQTTLLATFSQREKGFCSSGPLRVAANQFCILNSFPSSLVSRLTSLASLPLIRVDQFNQCHPWPILEMLQKLADPRSAPRRG
jgi:hypothetical protein